MKKIDFNKGWICRCLSEDLSPAEVTLPHDAMLSEPRTEGGRGDGNIGWYAGRDYEYSKTFILPKELRTQNLILEFEGVYHDAQVYVNGKEAMFRPYGYTNFYVNLNPMLEAEEENTIRVIAHNTDQPNSRWYPGTGIYRPVFLYAGGERCIPVNGVRIRTLSYSPAIIEVEVKTSADGEVEAEICREGKRVVLAKKRAEGQKAVFQIKIPDARLWSPKSPELYECKVTFGGDTVCETFGIRTLEWGTEGMKINGERILLRGACIHHDNGILGACAYPEAEERKVRILLENGYNAIRSSHYPCSKAMLDACDRLGMLVMDEYVDVWYIHKTEHDYANYLMKWWKQDFRDWVDKDYNHPCVIMYSTGNEVSETAQEKGIRLTGEMTKYLHELDSTRPVTCGINIFFNFLSSIGLGVYSDDKAKKSAEAAGKNAKKAKEQPEKKKKKPVGSEFYNTLACLMGDYFMKWGATLYPCDVKTRDAYANMDIAGYNYGIFRYKHDLKKYPDRLILGSETFCKDAYAFYEIAKKNPRIIGDFVWSGIDYIGETGDGAAEYKDYKSKGTLPMTGENGRIDLLGKPRAEAAYTKVALERETGPYLAVLPVYEKEIPRISGWKLTKAMESWSWEGCEGMPAVVEVYARAAEVELLVNGKSVGRKKMKKNCRFVFKTTYSEGEVTAISYNADGKKTGSRTLKSAGKGSFLNLKPESERIREGGLCFIPMQYTDAEGIWKPMERHHLSIRVENGNLKGFGSAAPYVDGNYTDDHVETYFGEAMAVVQADGKGPLRIYVSDEKKETVAEIPLEE